VGRSNVSLLIISIVSRLYRQVSSGGPGKGKQSYIVKQSYINAKAAGLILTATSSGMGGA
jgi:hypothetical protein